MSRHRRHPGRVAGTYQFHGGTTKGTTIPVPKRKPANDISYPMLDDQESRTALQLGRLPMAGLPDTVLVDRQGRVAAVYVGPVQAGDLSPVLATLAAEK